jgi:hypothetical protein
MSGLKGRCVVDRLSAFLDGDLPAIEASTVRAHLDGCADCSRAAAEMSALVQTARTLDHPEPPLSLWPAIEGQLGKLGRLDAQDARRARRGWLLRPFAAGALLGAAAVGALVLGLGRDARRTTTATPTAPGPAVAEVSRAPVDPMIDEAEAEFAQAAAAYERSIEKLRGLLEREETRWSPQERAQYTERVARLDDAIARSRELARRTPGDSAGNEQLFAAYHEKIEFLAAAVHRGGTRGREP